MKLYQYISETEIKPYKGKYIVLNNMIITNPTEEKLREAGYKELVVEDKPEFDISKQYITPKYIDGDVITQTWEIKEMPEVIPNENTEDTQSDN